MSATPAAHDQATFITALGHAALEALETLRAVMAHARNAAAEPLPKSLEKARIAAAKVLHIAGKVLIGTSPAPAPTPRSPAKPDPHRIPTYAEIDSLIARFRKGLPPTTFPSRHSPVPVAGAAQPHPST